MCNEVCENTDYDGKKPEEIEKIEDLIFDEIQQFQSKLVEARAKLDLIIENLRRTSEPNPTARQTRQSLSNTIVDDTNVLHPKVKLPDIPVPKFNGTVKGYPDWLAMFNVTIHNNAGLAPAQKLYYLKRATIESSPSLLSDFDIDDKLYEPA